MRIRLKFAKSHAMRFTGHLDLHRTWERTFRRAGLPLAYSQGFNPRPRLQLASALPLGFISEDEIMDAWLEQELPLADIERALQAALPPGIQVFSLEQISGTLPPLQTQLHSCEYILTLHEPIVDLEGRVRSLLAAQSIAHERRGKLYDLRQTVIDIEILPPEDGCQRLLLRLTAQEGATGRPDEVLVELGGNPHLARIHRTRLDLRSDPSV